MELNKTGPDKEACTCPICMYIMVEPVTMPCKHTLCMYCYKQTVAQSNLVCPICRQRISVWARRAAKTKSLVDLEKWVIIQTAFPQKVKRRMEAVAAGLENKDSDEEEDSDDEDCATYLRKLKEISKPGEIREEYDAAMRKLQQQRELEAKKEEEASAALIRALQEEEQREMERLRQEREKLERLGLEVAQQLQDGSFEEMKDKNNSAAQGKPSAKAPTPKGASKSKKSSRQARPMSAAEGKMNTLNNFFSPAPRTPSAPPIHAQLSRLEQQKGKELSPYPYKCISPKDKIFYGLSALGGSNKSTPRPRSNSCSSDEAPGLQDEHSYTTSSAKVVDLTNPAVAKELCKKRTDVESYDLSKVKSEPEDIFGPGPSGLGKYVSQSPVACGSSQHDESTDSHVDSISPSVGTNCFQPIVAHMRTPPKPQANGRTVEVPISRITPRKILLDTPSPISVCSEEVLSRKNLTARMKSKTGVGKTSAAALINKKAEQELKKTSEDIASPTPATAAPSGLNSSVVTNSRVCSPSAGASVNLKSVSEALTVYIEDEFEVATDVSPGGTNHNTIGTSNSRSDQENSAIVWSDDQHLCGPTGDQPLQVSKALNKPVSMGDGPEMSVSDESSHSRAGKARSFKDSSANCKPQKSAESNAVVVRKKNGNVKKPPVPHKKTGKRGKSNKKLTTTPDVTSSLDSFVKRKKRTFSYTQVDDTDTDDSIMTQEEKDHILALQLQEMYEDLDKNYIDVDRFKGSVNEYSLRKKRKV